MRSSSTGGHVRSAVLGRLPEVLAVQPADASRTERERPLERREIAGECVQQRRLATAVRPDHRDALAGDDRQRRHEQQGRVSADDEPDALEGHPRRRRAAEAQPRLAVDRRRCDTLQPVEPRLPAPRLARTLARPCTCG